MQFQLLCFDLDGTLVDSTADIRAALSEALMVLGSIEANLVERALGSAGLGLPLEDFYRLVRPDGDAAGLAAFIAAYRGYYHAHLLDRTRPFDGVVETLSRLRPLRERGLRTAVATTKKTDTARRVIEGLGLAEHFDAVLGTDGIPHKPAPDLLLLAARTVQRVPESGLMIGDTDRDVLAGRAAGMKTCAVGWGVMGHEGLRAHGPDYEISRFEQLLELV